jgi:hypothetical protein
MKLRTSKRAHQNLFEPDLFEPVARPPSESPGNKSGAASPEYLFDIADARRKNNEAIYISQVRLPNHSPTRRQS